MIKPGDTGILGIGIDDTDSPRGMCTTYVMHRIINEVVDMGGSLIDYPRLIRLNPTCPFKTRGNAALASFFKIDEELKARAKEMVVEKVEELSEMDQPGTDPGVVFSDTLDLPDEIKNFSEMAVKKMVSMEHTRVLLRKYRLESVGFNGGRGIVGALAALGNSFKFGYTFELIAYRRSENWGKKRLVSPQSVENMSVLTHGCTFDNLDDLTGEIKITPHTSCPVLLGIRSVDSNCLEQAFKLLDINEVVDGHRIFKTNQATDSHISKVDYIKMIEPYTTVVLRALVVSPPKVEVGGHVFIWVGDGENSIRAAAYEPTKSFRESVKSLIAGDLIDVYGSYKPVSDFPPTINLEKFEVIRLAAAYSNPPCPECGHTMKSEGFNKGFQCPKCKFRSTSVQKVPIRRTLKIGMYTVPPRARRHLSRPVF
ncbi:MAG: DUF1743 domain-containing protein [Nitrososphaerota archaeon]|jgi:tRNA(Ile2)-agmatinylcytidine synthase|nr:DUF1743 domain-containing protein [Nitrososphaerota archaeon]MDG7039829.1 DUF1743 domain-containing protein [Nitrososphaerota archaeon]MDG7046055.1 DUF1743 domain-containing protein [Nitrososphaerota archaeon]